MKITRRDTLKQLVTAGLAGLSGCLRTHKPTSGNGDRTQSSDTTDEGEDTDTDETVRAAFVYHDAVGDFGWQWAHDQARRAVEDDFDWVETEVFEKVPPEGSEPRFRQYAERGFDVIFGTSWDYMDPMYEVAPDYPDVAFEHCSGYRQRENLGCYFGRMYEPRYLTGVAAGLLTETDRLGYVAAFPISEVIRGINGFALGASSVNEDVTVSVKYTQTWNDAGIESNTAERLIEEGVDVMAQHQNFPAAAETAAEEGIWATGYNSDIGELIGENYVTSPVWNWEVFYGDAVNEIRDGNWESDFYWEGIESGIVGLSDWGSEVPDEVIERVETKRREIENGNLSIWGGTRFEEFDTTQLFRNVDSYVDAVEGEVPQ